MKGEDMMKNTPEAIWDKIQTGVFIIAEAGKNFIQSKEEQPVSVYLKNAKELVDAAAGAGADAIKFQTHSLEDEQLNVEVKASHFSDMDRYRWVGFNTRVTPVEEFWKPLKDYCESKGIVFFSTPMSRGAARRLTKVGVSLWKVGSGDILDYVCNDYMRRTGIPIIMSSGASTLNEVETSLNYLREKNSRVALMHALSKYPGKPEEANLAVMLRYRKMFPGVPVGFSENSVGTEPSVIAVALGATMIEKHFTTDRSLWGADHKVCSTPEEFKLMVKQIHNVQASKTVRDSWLNYRKVREIVGDGEKVLREDEASFRPVFQKTLAAGKDVPAGTALTSEMIYAMRPRVHGKGFPSEMYEEILGKRTNRALKKYDPINDSTLV